jgi:DNA-directed RNA polymerase specialized sigma subunit
MFHGKRKAGLTDNKDYDRDGREFEKLKIQTEEDKKEYIEMFEDWVKTGTDPIEKHLYIVDQVVARYCTRHPSWKEDAKSVGSLALAEAAVGADVSENPEAYFRTCVRNSVLNFIRDEELRQRTISEPRVVTDYERGTANSSV